MPKRNPPNPDWPFFMLPFPGSFTREQAIVAFGMLTGREPVFLQKPGDGVDSWMAGYANREDVRAWLQWRAGQGLPGGEQ